MADMDSVRVALRIRPLVRSELDTGCQVAVERAAGSAQVIVNRSDPFTFNYVFDISDTQEYIYNECVLEMLDKLFDGFNTTILAYGQTGSGKTYTMGTAFDGVITEHVGVIPRVMVDIFERIQKYADETDFIVKCSFMELYQEQLFDLLSNKSRDESVVDLREDRTGIIIPGLTEVSVKTAKETTDCLVRGSSGRAVASTAMNEQSSRSHAIFTLTLQATKRDELNSVTVSKFHLVDLAGSERSKKTQASGERFKEGVKINQGLLALGNVISALGSGHGSGFVRYRDSKLTRLLQDSLGGNSITLMIACVSPADYNVNETLSTLRYADRARRIKNKPVVNQDPHVAEINNLKGIIQKLRLELLAAGGGMSSSLTNDLQKVAMPVAAIKAEPGVTTCKPGEADAKLKAMQEKYQLLQQQLQVTLHDVAENEMRVHIAEAAHEKIKARADEMRELIDELRGVYAEDARIEKLQGLIHGMDEELSRTETEISEHKQHYSLNSSIDESANGEENADITGQMQEQADAFTSKQVELKQQIRRINRELSVKEVLHQRVRGNLNKFCGLDDNIEEKVKECEQKIKDLETEKQELLDKLKHVKDNASAKLAEERRKRLQALEQEINDFKRKNVQQAKMLKLREKETQKIQNLNSEIQAMKESKVKLIRAMRQESENFRQWKLTREKELMQLKNKDRKMQNEMARKEALHLKQRNVLKRKCDEALAINKRLKDAMERQRVAQQQRSKNTASKEATKIDQVIAHIDRELEVIISLIDAENSLEQLMEDRGIISSRITELQKQKKGQPNDSQAQEELQNMKEDLEMRNAQIADLQQKVCAVDLEARMRSLSETFTSLSDARAVLKHLLKTLAEMRRDHANRMQSLRTTIDDQRTQLESVEEQCTKSNKRMRQMEMEHEKEIAERENTYEDKIAVLLRELYKVPTQLNENGVLTPEQEERKKIEEEQLNKMDSLREELEYYKKLVEDLQDAVAKSNRKNGAKKDKTLEDGDCVMLNTTESDLDFEDDEHDPDWKMTPRFRRPAFRTSRNTSNHSNGSPTEDTFVTATTSNTTANNRQSTKPTRRGCKCRTGCKSRQCGCVATNEKCSSICRCSEACCNRTSDPDADAADIENTPPQNTLKRKSSETVDSLMDPPSTTMSTTTVLKMKNDVVNASITHNGTTTAFDAVQLTPKIARLSSLSFATPSAKKFFQ